MQLSPSTFPIDPSLLSLLMPGGVPGAAPVAPAAPGGQAAISFAELLPGAEPAVIAPVPESGNPLAGVDAPLGSGRPEIPVLGAEPMPFQRFVTATPEISSDPPVGTVKKEEEPSLPVVADAKDKTPKLSVPPKRFVVRSEQPKKESVPELVFFNAPAAPIAADLPTAPISDEETVGRDAELPQSQPEISVRAEISTRIKSPVAPLVMAKFAPATEAANATEPNLPPAARETPSLPQAVTRGQPKSPLTSDVPEHSPVGEQRPLTTAEPAQTEPINPAIPEPALVARQLEPRLPPPPQTPNLPQGADYGKLQLSLPPTSRAVEHSPVWSLRPFVASQPIPTAESVLPAQPVFVSAAPAEIAPQLPAPAASPVTPLSAETIEATVAPALELNLSPLPEAGLPAADPREHPENFAESTDEFRVNFASTDRASQKTFVGSDVERLTQRPKTVGIGGAKPVATMPSRFSFTPTPHPAFEYAPATAVPALEDRATFVAEAPAPTAAPQEVASAQHAVEAVLRAVDHVATREQHSVNLHFSVGETDLKVRVELRADEVRTTFSTDSAELRSALSHEWQAVEHSDASGSVRIAPATFTSDHAATNLSGDASSRDRQQHQHAHHGQNEFAQGRAGFGRPASPASSDARPEVRPASLFVHAGSRHLSTLA